MSDRPVATRDATRPSSEKDECSEPRHAERAPTAPESDPHERGDDADGDDDEPPQRKKPLGFHLTVVGVMLLELVYSLDATSLAVAIPAITDEAGGTTLEAFWASIAYLLAVVVVQPLYASISDAFGRTVPLYVGCLLFAAGSIVFATGPNMRAVIAGRVLQGLGGGGINVLGEIIVADMTTLRERPFYGGLLALPTAVGSILGPTVGALFSDFVTWRWIGWINLPVLGVAGPLLVVFLRLRSLETTLSQRIRSVDWMGMVLFAVGCAAFVVPLSWAGSLYPWGAWQTLVPLLIGVALLVVFAVTEARPVAPLLPHRIFASRTASLTLVMSFLHGLVLFPLLLYLPLLYQAILLQTRIASAVSLLATSVASVASAVGAAIAVGVVGRGYRWGIGACWALTTLGAGLLGLVDATTAPHMYRGIPVIWGIGVGGLLRLLQLPIQASLPDVDDTSRAVSLVLSFRVLGGVVGLAVGSTVFSSVFRLYISGIQALPAAALLPQHASDAVGFIPKLIDLHLPPGEMHTLIHAYLTALRAIFYVMTGCAGLGLLSSLFIEELTLHKTELGKQQYQQKE